MTDHLNASTLQSMHLADLVYREARLLDTRDLETWNALLSCAAN